MLIHIFRQEKYNMKLIATDLDGTLLNEEGEISKENVQAIKKAMDEEIEFVVATGRSYDAACKPLHAAGLSAPVISLNGANTFALDQTMVQSISMEKPVAKKIQRVADVIDKIGRASCRERLGELDVEE